VDLSNKRGNGEKKSAGGVGNLPSESSNTFTPKVQVVGNGKTLSLGKKIETMQRAKNLLRDKNWKWGGLSFGNCSGMGKNCITIIFNREGRREATSLPNPPRQEGRR